jgi:hypothetical protein
MKITSIIICVLLLISCGCSREKKATLTYSQALEIAVKKLPPIPNGSAGEYLASYRDGNWTIALKKDARIYGSLDLVPVAVVNDSDKSVEIIKKP